MWWGAPFAYACQALGHAPETFDELFAVGKTPFFVAVVLWTNSWVRNGVACRGAAALRDIAGDDRQERNGNFKEDPEDTFY